MAILHKTHTPDKWAVPVEEQEMMMRAYNKQNGAKVDDPIDIRIRNQFYRMETRGKRVYKDAMSKIGVEV